MPVMQITTGENTYYDRRYAYDSAYNVTPMNIGRRNQSTTNDIYRAFLKWNIPQLQGKIIKSASVKLYIRSLTGYTFVYSYPTNEEMDIIEINTNNAPSPITNDRRDFIIDTEDVGAYKTINAIGTLVRNYLRGDYPTGIVRLQIPYADGDVQWAQIDGFNGPNPPILEIDYDFIPPQKPTELNANYTPSNGTTEFTWQFNPSSSGGDTPTGYSLQYGYDKINWTTVNRDTTESKHTFPIGTFNSGVIYWRVQTKNSFGGISEWSDTAEFLFSGHQTGTPVIVSPAGNIVIDADVVFQWQYNPSGTWDIQNRYELQYSFDGSTWKTIFANSADTSVTVPKSEFQSGTVWWRVRVRNTYNYMSQWSTTTTFTFAGKPKAPVIISGNSFSVANVTIEWISTEQVSYQVRILEGSNVIVDTGEVVTATQKKYSRVLENNKTYTVQVRIKNQFGLWSDYSLQTITVNFQLPAKPKMYLLGNEKRGSIEVKIINGTGGAAFLENEVYRRKPGITEWTRIAKGVSQNATFVDYTVISEEEYEYKVRTIGATLGYNDSDADATKVKVRNTQLANTADYREYVELIYNPKKDLSLKFDEHLMKFAGRRKPIVERGEVEETRISMSFTILGYENLEKLIALIRKRETLLLRDSRKKKMYVTIDNLQVQEDWKTGEYEISFSVTEVDHAEVVL